MVEQTSSTVDGGLLGHSADNSVGAPKSSFDWEPTGANDCDNTTHTNPNALVLPKRDFSIERKIAAARKTPTIIEAQLDAIVQIHAAQTEWQHAETSATLSRWFRIFNCEFFRSELPPPAISIQRVRRDTLGSYLTPRNGMAWRYVTESTCTRFLSTSVRSPKRFRRSSRDDSLGC